MYTEIILLSNYLKISVHWEIYFVFVFFFFNCGTIEYDARHLFAYISLYYKGRNAFSNHSLLVCIASLIQGITCVIDEHSYYDFV